MNALNLTLFLTFVSSLAFAGQVQKASCGAVVNLSSRSDGYYGIELIKTADSKCTTYEVRNSGVTGPINFDRNEIEFSESSRVVENGNIRIYINGQELVFAVAEPKKNNSSQPRAQRPSNNPCATMSGNERYWCEQNERALAKQRAENAGKAIGAGVAAGAGFVDDIGKSEK